MKELVNFVIVGHVDHGKSSLIGRLLYQTASLPKAKMKEVQTISKELGKKAEIAFVTDQLKEEREKGITIDIAQIPFKSKRRHYNIIDAPGHVEFTQNMITGAAQADFAILLVDVKEGVQEQTKRHSYLLNFLGLSKVIVAINKMDLIDYNQKHYDDLLKDLKVVFDNFNFEVQAYVPISATQGENITKKSSNMPWYSGPSIIQAIDAVKTDQEKKSEFRMSIQDVYSIDNETICVGEISSGTLMQGEEVLVHPENEKIKIDKLQKFPDEVKKAMAKENIGLQTTSKLKRGSVLLSKNINYQSTNTLKGNLFWMNPEPLEENQKVRVRIQNQETVATVTGIKNKIDTSDLNLLEKSADLLNQFEGATVKLNLEKPMYFEPIQSNLDFGRFVIASEFEILGAGVVNTYV